MRKITIDKDSFVCEVTTEDLSGNKTARLECHVLSQGCNVRCVAMGVAELTFNNGRPYRDLYCRSKGDLHPIYIGTLEE